MAKRNTKELILLEALKLFADKGYEGVSVRDIAAEVGIRQSSLYKHFESKQDIFDTLVETMKNRFPQASASSRWYHTGSGKRICHLWDRVPQKDQRRNLPILFERPLRLPVPKDAFHREVWKP